MLQSHDLVSMISQGQQKLMNLSTLVRQQITPLHVSSSIPSLNHELKKGPFNGIKR